MSPLSHRSLAVALVLCATPAALRAQSRVSICMDGSTSIASAQYACVGHGGVNVQKTLAQSREPGAGSRTASFPTRTNEQPRRESPAARAARLEREAQARRERERREAKARRESDFQTLRAIADYRLMLQTSTKTPSTY